MSFSCDGSYKVMLIYADETEQDVEDPDDGAGKDEEKGVGGEEEEEEEKNADEALSDNKESSGTNKAENDKEIKEPEQDFSVTTSKDSESLQSLCWRVSLVGEPI
jgi:hypothetical protein